MKEKSLLASVALFGELYNNEKYKSISDIIAEFIKGAIVFKNKYSFNSTELKDLLEEVYGFRIPESVIRTTLHGKLKDSVNRKDGYYHFNSAMLISLNNITEEFESKSKSQNVIFSNLIEFVQKKENKIINEIETKELLDNFNHFLLDNGYSDKYSNHISTFVVLNENNYEFRRDLNLIREGVILYQGINFTADVNELGKWNSELTLYLNTEMLFNALGYNGILFKEIFDDFYKLVTEINSQHSKNKNRKKIELKFFEETKIELDNFFSSAELILNGYKQLDPTKSAMKLILEGCRTPSDIKAKKIKFDLELEQKSITIQKFNVDINSYSKYNVEDITSLEKLRTMSLSKNKKFDDVQCYQYFKIFTKINFYRKGESKKNFEDIGHLLITENSFAKFLAHNNLVKFEEYDIPFAKDIDFITTKFWFKLKKGFSDKNALPKSFDVLTKAKIILSSHLNTSVSKGYHRLLNEVKEGKLSKEEALIRSYEFREKPNRPEEITIANVDKSLDFLNNESYFEDIHRERERKDKLFEEAEKEKRELKEQLEKYKKTEEDRRLKSEEDQYNKQKEEYIEIQWQKTRRVKWLDLVYLLLTSIPEFLLVLVGLFVKVNNQLNQSIESLGINIFGFWFILTLIITAFTYGKAHLFNKDRIKSGWNWFLSLFNYSKTKADARISAEKEFLSVHSKAIL